MEELSSTLSSVGISAIKLDSDLSDVSLSYNVCDWQSWFHLDFFHWNELVVFKVRCRIEDKHCIPHRQLQLQQICKILYILKITCFYFRQEEQRARFRFERRVTDNRCFISF
jgi:hypothetical protein